METTFYLPRSACQVLLATCHLLPTARELDLEEPPSELAENFNLARSPLNYMTDFYLRSEKSGLFQPEWGQSRFYGFARKSGTVPIPSPQTG